MTFLSRGFGFVISAMSYWSPSQPQKESAIESVAGPQLFQPWYSWRKPESWTLPGMGVGERVGVGMGVDVAVGPTGGIVGVRLGRFVGCGDGVSLAVFSP